MGPCKGSYKGARTWLVMADKDSEPPPGYTFRGRVLSFRKHLPGAQVLRKQDKIQNSRVHNAQECDSFGVAHCGSILELLVHLVRHSGRQKCCTVLTVLRFCAYSTTLLPFGRATVLHSLNIFANFVHLPILRSPANIPWRNCQLAESIL